MGELTIDLPNGADGRKLTLTEVLYSPEVGYTLVSVGQLDDLGFIMTFGNGKCTIRRPDGNIIGEVPKSSSGLYHVEHETDTANAIKFITLDKFHHRMGHISPEIARRLIARGFVTGVKLNNSPAELTFCESCIYAKATCKSIPKVCQGECTKEIGGEVHSDIWGPAPVAMLHGRRYYVSFIDDKTCYGHAYFLHKRVAPSMPTSNLKLTFVPNIVHPSKPFTLIEEVSTSTKNSCGT
jgi:hypothetical protein